MCVCVYVCVCLCVCVCVLCTNKHIYAFKQLLETLFLAINMCTDFTTDGICMNTMSAVVQYHFYKYTHMYTCIYYIHIYVLFLIFISGCLSFFTNKTT